MNKIYKLVWSKVRNTWVVTSEIAKGHGKNSSSGSKRKSLKIAVMAAFFGGGGLPAQVRGMHLRHFRSGRIRLRKARMLLPPVKILSL